MSVAMQQHEQRGSMSFPLAVQSVTRVHSLLRPVVIPLARRGRKRYHRG